MKSPIKVLILSIYSKEEDEILGEFSNLFPTFEGSHNLTIVTRLKIGFDEEIEVFFNRESEEADIIIVLVSANLLGSKFIHKGSINQAISSENKSVIPLLIQSCIWDDIDWIGEKGLFPRSGTPLFSLNKEERETEYTTIFQMIVRQSEKIIGKNISKNSIQKEIVVFISHSHEDGDFADLLKLKFKDFGIKSWLDVDNILIGQEWMESIDYAITKSDAIIVILSPSSKASEYVIYEWAFALGKNKIIIPIKLEAGDVHPILMKKQSIDFSNRGLRPWNELVRQIKESIDRNNEKANNNKVLVSQS